MSLQYVVPQMLQVYQQLLGLKFTADPALTAQAWAPGVQAYTVCVCGCVGVWVGGCLRRGRGNAHVCAGGGGWFEPGHTYTHTHTHTHTHTRRR